MLHHPDCRPGDPDAASLRFRQIVAAYAILRDAKRRAAYDRRLALERQRIRSERMRAIISGASLAASHDAGDRIPFDRAHFFDVYRDGQSEDGHGTRTDRDGGSAIASAKRCDRPGWTPRQAEIIPERAIEPSAAEPATNGIGIQTIVKHGPARRPLPNALGLQPDEAEFHLERRREMSPGRLGRVHGHL